MLVKFWSWKIDGISMTTGWPLGKAVRSGGGGGGGPRNFRSKKKKLHSDFIFSNSFISPSENHATSS